MSAVSTPVQTFADKYREACEHCDADRPQEALALASEVAEAARGADLIWEARASELMVTCHFKLWNPPEQLRCALRAMACWEQTDDEAGQVRALFHMSEALYASGALQQSLELGDRALARAEKLGDADMIVRSLNACGLALEELSLSDRAQALHQRALELLDQKGDRGILYVVTMDRLANSYTHAATDHLERGEREQAEPLLRKAVDLHRKILTHERAANPDQPDHPVGLMNILVDYNALGDVESAGTVAEATLEAARRHGGTGMLAAVLLNVANTRSLQGRLEEAKALLYESIRLGESVGMAYYVPQAWLHLAQIAEREKDSRSALRYYRQYSALELAQHDEASLVSCSAIAVLRETETARERAEADRLRADILESVNRELGWKTQRLTKEVNTDALTRLANRRCFDEALKELRAAGRPFLLALMDIDHFKRVNDQFSHLIGDEVLRRVGRLLKHACRPVDLAARYGGEEFAILLPDMSAAQGRALAERVRQTIERAPWREIHPDLKVTISIGVAETAEAEDAAHLLRLADERLYAAKQQGRNRVVLGALLAA